MDIIVIPEDVWEAVQKIYPDAQSYPRYSLVCWVDHSHTANCNLCKRNRTLKDEKDTKVRKARSPKPEAQEAQEAIELSESIESERNERIEIMEKIERFERMERMERMGQEKPSGRQKNDGNDEWEMEMEMEMEMEEDYDIPLHNKRKRKDTKKSGKASNSTLNAKLSEQATEQNNNKVVIKAPLNSSAKETQMQKIEVNYFCEYQSVLEPSDHKNSLQTNSVVDELIRRSAL